jgi:peptidoglycan-N-acetylglucosamine deacetylase
MENRMSSQQGSQQLPVNVPEPIIEFWSKNHTGTFLEKFLQAIKEAAVYSIILLGSMLMIKVYELVRDAQKFGIPKDFFKVIIFGIINDISFTLNIAIVPVGIFILLYFFSRKISRLFFITFSLLLIAVHAMLAEYFLETLNPLGADLLKYSLADIKQTVGAAGISMSFICSTVLMLGFIVALFIMIPKKLKFSTGFSYTMIGLYAITGIVSIASITNSWKPGQEFSNNISLNKSYFFYSSCYRFLHGVNEDVPTDTGVLSANASFN